MCVKLRSVCVKLHSVCVKLHSVCVKLHTVCEITQCAQNNTYSIGKKSSQLKNFTVTPWAAWATNISCASSLIVFIFCTQDSEGTREN